MCSAASFWGGDGKSASVPGAPSSSLLLSGEALRVLGTARGSAGRDGAIPSKMEIADGCLAASAAAAVFPRLRAELASDLTAGASMSDAAGADFSETAVALAAISIPCKAGRRII